MSARRRAARAARRQAGRGPRLGAPPFLSLVSVPDRVRRSIAPVIRGLADVPIAELVGREIIIVDDAARVMTVGPILNVAARDMLRRAGFANVAAQLDPFAGQRFRLVYLDGSGKALFIGCRLGDAASVMEVAG